MKQFFRQNGFLLLLIGALLSILLGLTSALMGGNADPLSNVFRFVTTPVRNGVTAVANWTEGVYTFLFRYEEMEQELAQLRVQVAEMEQLARQGEDALRENAQYRQLLGLQEKRRDFVFEDALRENAQYRQLLGLQEKRRDFVFEDARVTAPATSNWASTLTISKGSSSGIHAGDCVITETGVLVGVVSEVATNSAEVSTIINTDIDMGGMVARTYSAGILEGDFSLMEQGKLKLSYLPDSAQLVAGDVVLTSGKGGVYPSGLVVGAVEGVFTDPSGKTRYAVILPDVELDSLIEVFVIKEFDIVE